MYHLPDLYKQSLANNFITKEGLYINILHSPLHYNIQVFPLAMKEKIVKKYSLFFEWMEKNTIPQSVQVQFQACLDYLLAQDQSNYWTKYLSETKKLDEMRGEDGTGVLFLE